MNLEGEQKKEDARVPAKVLAQEVPLRDEWTRLKDTLVSLDGASLVGSDSEESIWNARALDSIPSGTENTDL